MFEQLGNWGERLGASLYPYRFWLLAAVTLLVAGVGLAAARAGAHRAVARHPWRYAVGTAVTVALLGPVLVYLGSPLFTRTELHEASPLQAATVATSTVAAAPTTPATSTASPAPPVKTATPTATREVTASTTPTPTAPASQTPEPTPPAPTPFAPRVLASGEFRGADDFHFGMGKAILIESEPGVFTVRFEDFSVRNGPDLFVYLSPDPAGYTDAAVNIGELRATDGNYNHPIPPGTDVTATSSVVIWCRQFAVLFAVAELIPA